MSSIGKKIKKVIASLSILCAVFFCGTQVQMPWSLSACMAYAAYPLLKMQQAIVQPVEHFFADRKIQKELAEYAQVVSSDNALLQEENVRLHALLYEAKTLKELSDAEHYRAATKKRYAHIMLKNMTEREHYVLVDRGSNHGIVQDMVAVYKECIIGKVVQVYPCYSKVQLVSDKQCKIAAYCAQTGTIGIHEGANNTDNQGALKHISHLQTIHQGDLLLSSGEGLVFPRGFALGKIKTARLKNLLYHIDVEPLVDMQAITHCCLLQKGDV